MQVKAPLRVLFFNGWSLSSGYVEDFARDLAGGAEFQVVDIDETFAKLDWQASLECYVDENTLIVGWSLGGMLACQYARWLNNRNTAFAGLMLLMATPCFVKNDLWPQAMARAHFDQFATLVDDERKLAIRFSYMLTPQGGVSKDLHKSVSKRYKHNLLSYNARSSTLNLLESLDLTEELSCLQPALWVFGSADRLISNAYVEQFQQRYPNQCVQAIEDAGHDPTEAHTKECILKLIAGKQLSGATRKRDCVG